MPHNPYDNYLESQILSATPVQLVAILFRAAIESLQSARLHLAAGEIRARTADTNRATNLIVELTQSINLEKGGEIATNLLELYDYILRRVHLANAHADDSAYAEAIRLLSTVLEAWQTISEISEPDHSTGNREPIECLF
jgi:flagellar protein FliS